MGNVAGSLSRNRQQSETKNVFNSDLEPTQQSYANASNGPGARIGSYGMSGGQFPTAGKDPAGFGSGGYGYPGQYKGSGSNSQGYQGDAGMTGGSWGPAGQTGRYVQMGADPGGTIMGSNASMSPWNKGGGQYWGPGNTGQPGSGSLYYGGGREADPSRGGYQFGPGNGQGYGGYSAMQQPGYQFGSEGAQGDLNATGAAAYGGYGGVSQGYGQLGGQYARLGRQGVTQAERSNLMAASNEAIQAQSAASRDQIANRAAQSGNAAGVAGAQARLGANMGQQLESADRANQTAILQENQRRKEAGLAGQGTALQGQQAAATGQAGLYGTGTGYQANLLAGRGRLASLNQRSYTQGAGTGGTVSGSGSFGG